MFGTTSKETYPFKYSISHLSVKSVIPFLSSPFHTHSLYHYYLFLSHFLSLQLHSSNEALIQSLVNCIVLCLRLNHCFTPVRSNNTLMSCSLYCLRQQLTSSYKPVSDT